MFEHLKQSQTGSVFSPLIDAFHSPFPASIGEYIAGPCQVNNEDLTHGRPGPSNIGPDACTWHGNPFGHNAQCQMNNASANNDCPCRAHHYHAQGHGAKLLLGASGTIFNFPHEVSDLILFYLSPVALDAARYTCKAWWTIILSNTWLLSSVLGVRDQLLSGKLSHRDLLKKLDRDSDLPSTSQHPDTWRTRFRTRNLIFTLPSLASALTRPALVATVRTGTENGWLAFQLQEPTQDTCKQLRSTLLIYRFDLAEIPCYAGAVHDVEGQGTLRIVSLIETRRSSEWLLRIDIGDTTGLYSLTARAAFSNSGSRYLLKKLESWENVPNLSEDSSALQRFDDKVIGLHSIGDQSWNILSGVPRQHTGVSTSLILDQYVGTTVLRRYSFTMSTPWKVFAHTTSLASWPRRPKQATYTL